MGNLLNKSAISFWLAVRKYAADKLIFHLLKPTILLLLPMLASSALLGQIDLTDADDVQTVLEGSSTPVTDGSETVYWLDEGTYTATGTALFDPENDDFANSFSASLGIGENVSLYAIGISVSSPASSSSAGLSIMGNIYQTGGTVLANAEGAAGIFLDSGNYNLSGAHSLLQLLLL